MTSAKLKAAICMTRPIFRLAVSIRLVISRKRFVRASDLRLRREWPVFAPLSFVFMRVRFMRVGKTASRLAVPDIVTYSGGSP